jgi:hypothetical protein
MALYTSTYRYAKAEECFDFLFHTLPLFLSAEVFGILTASYQSIHIPDVPQPFQTFNVWNLVFFRFMKKATHDITSSIFNIQTFPSRRPPIKYLASQFRWFSRSHTLSRPTISYAALVD